MKRITPRLPEEKPSKARNVFAAMALAGSLSAGSMASSCNRDCALPGTCETKDYPVELREGERIETVSGQYPLRLEVLEGGITQEITPDLAGRCQVKSDRASVRLRVYPPGTTDLDAAAPVHTRDFYIYPGSCIGIWDYCIRIEGNEIPADIDRSVTVDDAGVATTACTPSNESVKFTISLSRGQVSTPDGGYFQDAGAGGSSDSSGGTGGS